MFFSLGTVFGHVSVGVCSGSGVTFTVRSVAIQAGFDSGALNRGMSFGKDDAAMK